MEYNIGSYSGARVRIAAILWSLLLALISLALPKGPDYSTYKWYYGKTNNYFEWGWSLLSDTAFELGVPFTLYIFLVLCFQNYFYVLPAVRESKKFWIFILLFAAEYIVYSTNGIRQNLAGAMLFFAITSSSMRTNVVHIITAPFIHLSTTVLLILKLNWSVLIIVIFSVGSFMYFNEDISRYVQLRLLVFQEYFNETNKELKLGHIMSVLYYIFLLVYTLRQGGKSYYLYLILLLLIFASIYWRLVSRILLLFIPFLFLEISKLRLRHFGVQEIAILLLFSFHILSNVKYLFYA